MIDLGGLGAAIAAIVGLIVAAVGYGWKKRSDKQELKDAKEYERTMDQTRKGSTSDDDADNDRWLRDRAKRKP